MVSNGSEQAVKYQQVETRFDTNCKDNFALREGEGGRGDSVLLTNLNSFRTQKHFRTCTEVLLPFSVCFCMCFSLSNPLNLTMKVRTHS